MIRNKRGDDNDKRGEYERDILDFYERAISDFNKAVEIDPCYAEAYYNRGREYFAHEEYDKAWKDVQNVQSLGYRRIMCLFLKGMIWLSKITAKPLR